MERRRTDRRGSTPAALLIVTLCSFSIAPATGPDGFWTPVEPPRAHYVIDARLDFAGSVIEGTETIEFKNDTRQPIAVLALDWSVGPASSITVSVAETALAPANPEESATISSPLYFRLPEPAAPGKKIRLRVAFRRSMELESGSASFVTSRFYPALWWDGLPTHGSYSVGVDVPEGYALAASGLINPKTGRYEAPAARTFGLFAGRGMKAESREVEGVLITAVATAKGAKAAAICLDTAGDVIKFARSWLGFYPFPFLTIVPGGSGRWGGYPVATGIVVIHGLETYKDGEPPLWWKWITAHEIGHEYWGEWVLDPDDPAWLWIAMGITLDTEYLTTRGIDPGRRAKWMSNYLDGVRSYYDMTVDIPPGRVEMIQYDHSNTVIHSKCPSLIFALDSVLNRPAFERIYKRCLKEYGGKRLGWRDFERVCEKETGQDLGWFFDQWLRSNAYLCYKITGKDSRPEGSGFRSTVTIRRLGTMKMAVPVRAMFEDGSQVTEVTERGLDTNILTFETQARLKEAVLDPDKKLAMLDEPLAPISKEAAGALARGWSDKDSAAVYQTIKGERIPNAGIWSGSGRSSMDTINTTRQPTASEESRA